MDHATRTPERQATSQPERMGKDRRDDQTRCRGRGPDRTLAGEQADQKDDRRRLTGRGAQPERGQRVIGADIPPA